MAQQTKEEFAAQIEKEEYDKFGSYKYDEDMYNSAFFREIVSQYLMLYKALSAKDPKSEHLLSLLKQYTEIDTDSDDYSYDKEADIVTGIINELDAYLGIAKRQRVETARDMDRRQKMRVFFEAAEDQYEILTNLKMFFNVLSTGLLSPGECPNPGIINSDAPFSSVNMPLFTHAARMMDISEETRNSIPFMMGLINIAQINPEQIRYMLRDNNDEIVMMKLWKRNGSEYEPLYVEIDKVKAYLMSVGKLRSESLWPGCIALGLESLGYDIEADDPAMLLDMVIGPNKDKYEGVDLLKPYEKSYETNPETEKVRMSFFNETMNIYASLINVRDYKARSVKETLLLIFAIKELLGFIIGCTGRPVSRAKNAMQLVKDKSDEVKALLESKAIGDMRLREACEKIDKMYRRFLEY